MYVSFAVRFVFVFVSLCISHIMSNYLFGHKGEKIFKKYLKHNLKIIQLSFTFGNIMFCHLICQPFDLEIKQRNCRLNFRLKNIIRSVDIECTTKCSLFVASQFALQISIWTSKETATILGAKTSA